MRKHLLLLGFAMMVASTFAATSRTKPNEQMLWGWVAPTIAEAENGTALPPGPGILLLGDALIAGPGEKASEPGPIRDRLGRLADKTGLIVGAPVIEKPNGTAGAGVLALTLVGPDHRVLAHGYPARPVTPITGVTFERPDLRDAPVTVNVDGALIGIAATSDAEMAIPRLGERGVTLVTLLGGPVDWARIERLAIMARLNRVALLIAARCTQRSSCIPSAAVDANGTVDLAAGQGHAFHRLRRWSPSSAKGLPTLIPQPARHRYSPELAELGRIIFFDTGISDTDSISCASCHNPTRGFADGRALGSGVRGRPTNRNVISLLNVAFRPALRWDNYASSLENFIKYPLSGHNEMDSHVIDEVVARIGRSPDYQARFAAVFGSDRISFAMVEQALATYMRTLVSGDSPFDRAMVDGQRHAMTESAWRGYALFKGRAGCSGCHSYSADSPFFTDFRAHNTGLGWDSARSRYRDGGAGTISTEALWGSFRTPTLRDVARTGPYMHDGSLRTLREVIEYFDRGGGGGPSRDSRMKPLQLSEQEKRDLEAFMVALTGTTRFDAAGRRIDRQLARQ